MATYSDSDRGIDWGERSHQSEAEDLARRISENRLKLMTARVLIYEDSEGTVETISKAHCTPSEMADLMDALDIDRHTVHAKGWYDPFLEKWVVSGPSQQLQQRILAMPPPAPE